MAVGRTDDRASAARSRPPDHLAWSIAATVLCCVPVGIPGIVFAARVEGLWNAGDHRGAWEASRQAKHWAIASVVVGGFAIAGYLLVLLLPDA